MALLCFLAFDGTSMLRRRFTFNLGVYVMFLLVLFVLELQGLLGFGRNDRLAHDLRRFARGSLGIVDRFEIALNVYPSGCQRDTSSGKLKR